MTATAILLAALGIGIFLHEWLTKPPDMGIPASFGIGPCNLTLPGETVEPPPVWIDEEQFKLGCSIEELRKIFRPQLVRRDSGKTLVPGRPVKPTCPSCGQPQILVCSVPVCFSCEAHTTGPGFHLRSP